MSEYVVRIGPNKYQYYEYIILHNPKPIPDRSSDWEFYHEDYDGAGDSGDRRGGTATSMQEAIDKIEEMEDDDFLEKLETDEDFNFQESSMNIASLEVLAKSDPTLFAETIKQLGLLVIGTRESDPLQTQVQEELVSAMASAITEDINDNTELTAQQKAVYRLAEEYGYIIQVL